MVDAAAGEMDAASNPDPVRALEEAFLQLPIENATLLVGSQGGTVLTFSKGSDSETTLHKIASGTKWVTAAAIARAIARGSMSLSSRPQDFLPWWTSDPEDARSKITLQHLLSFTSGMYGTVFEPVCLYGANVDPETCVKRIYELGVEAEPGATFFYNEKHLQVAMLMAMKATGKATMQALFDDLLGKSLASLHGEGFRMRYEEPSAMNPRAGSGLVTDARSYATFLRLILSNARNSSDGEFNKDRTGAGVQMVFTPIKRPGQQWHYAFGHWIECNQSPFAPSCLEDVVLSSPGALGWYPFMVPAKGYWALLGTEIPLASGEEPVSDKAIAAGQMLRPLIEAAVATWNR